jgi:protein SCO1/2
MNTRLLWVGAGLLALIGAVMAAVMVFPKNDSFRGTLYDPALPAPGVELTQGNGSSFRLGEMRGRVVLLFFGYTSCPDVCPTTLSELRRVVDGLGADAARVQVVFVTVDPERDTPEKLGKYVAMFNPSFIGLGGPLEALETVWRDYGVYRAVQQMPNSATGYLVDHTARLYVIDPDGNLRLSFSYGAPIEDILHDVKLLLKSEE